MARAPLAWGLGVTFGIAVAVFIGGYLPSWGIALSPAVATAVFAVGIHRVPEDETLAMVLRVTVALTIGFVAATVPITLERIASSPQAALEAEEVLLVRGVDEVRRELVIMWSVMASMTPVGVGALFLRRRRSLPRDD